MTLVSLSLLLALAAAPDSGATAGPAVTSPDSAGAATSVPDSIAGLPFTFVDAPALAAADSTRGLLVEPSGVVSDAFGRVWVSDAAQHRLQRWNERGRWSGETGRLGSDPGQLRHPTALARLGTLGIAALDLENRRIVSYDLFGRLNGVLIDLTEPSLADAIGRVDPVDLATDRGGALYLADADRDRVLGFDFAGRFVRTLGGFGAKPGSFRGIAGLATTPRGELVVSERGGARVQRLDAGGRVAAWWPLPVRAGDGAVPVAVDDSARVAIADETGGRLWLFDERGKLLAQLEGLKAPRALAFVPDGRLLIAEAAAGRIRSVTLVPAPGPRPASRKD